ncbi:ankyrin repeat-containing domain protein [Aspergillus bertholletiae]|uniref:Ankyrin repeat-containing domain protein n=1 Tax=Aspergillus bertholletiae TaxID=1226010 RepID=A0A5N7BI12_9EURO|nr:ankyrin repeat-containing domain protein [Aspergillus bertholletiae]
MQSLCPPIDDLRSEDLVEAVTARHVSIVKSLLETRRVDVNAMDGHDRSPLWHAVSSKKKEMVQLLLDNGGDITAADLDSMTPLHQAIEKGYTPVAKILLSCSNTESVKLVLKGGDGDGDTEYEPPLCLTARTGNVAIVRLLLGHGSDVNIPDYQRRTPLHLAAAKGVQATWFGQRQVAKCLLAEGQVDMNAVGSDRSTSLHHAVEHGDKLVFRLLLRVEGLDPNVSNSIGQTPLSRAVESSNLDMVHLLLTRCDIRVNAMNPNQPSPLWLAVKAGHLSMVATLLHHPTIDPNKAWGIHLPPLLLSIVDGQEDIAMLLLGLGERLDVNARTLNGETALSLAAQRGSCQVVDRILQDRRTDVNCENKDGQTALWWAEQNGHTAVVERLRADPRVRFNIEE